MSLFHLGFNIISFAITVAILGVLVKFRFELGDYPELKWSVGLGTPVTVWAAVYFLGVEVVKRKWKRRSGNGEAEESSNPQHVDVYNEDDAERGEVLQNNG